MTFIILSKTGYGTVTGMILYEYREMFTPVSTLQNTMHLALAPLIAWMNQVFVQHRRIMHKLHRGNFHYCSTASYDVGTPGQMLRISCQACF
jgi:hypothetical protein